MVVSDDQKIREKSLPFFVSFFLLEEYPFGAKKKMRGSYFASFSKRRI